MEVDSIATPEFVAWCLTQQCDFRNRFDVADPLQTERSLKSLREASLAIIEQRCIEGWCLSRPTGDSTFHPTGFRLDDVVKRYGGGEFVSRKCSECPANVSPSKLAWAGCYGFFPLDEKRTALAEKLEALRSTPEATSLSEALAPSTVPKSKANCLWADLWRQPLLVASKATAVFRLLEQAISIEDRSSSDWLSLQQALAIVANEPEDSQLKLAVRHLPSGLVTGRDWLWPARCAYCQAARDDRRRCSRCGDPSPPLNLEKRGARGTRPYRDLKPMLSEDQLAELYQKLLAE